MRVMVAVLLLACACASESSRTSMSAGTERGPCYGNGTCNEGLSCLSDLCVRPPAAPAGDCGKVAEKLSFLMLDNYAAREQREAFVAGALAECEAAALTQPEAACLLGATHRNALSRCPKVIGVGDCAVIVAQLDRIRELGGADPYLVNTADRLQSRCKNETPSKAFERCVLAAGTMSDLDRCAW